MTERIHVYDAKNTERLLGSIEIPLSSRRSFCRALCFPVAERVPVRPYYLDDPIPSSLGVGIKEVCFQQLHIYKDYGWQVEVAVKTDTPLETLLMHPKFRLPGEDADKAARRHYYS